MGSILYAYKVFCGVKVRRRVQNGLRSTLKLYEINAWLLSITLKKNVWNLSCYSFSNIPTSERKWNWTLFAVNSAKVIVMRNFIMKFEICIKENELQGIVVHSFFGNLLKCRKLMKLKAILPAYQYNALFTLFMWGPLTQNNDITFIFAGSAKKYCLLLKTIEIMIFYYFRPISSFRLFNSPSSWARSSQHCSSSVVLGIMFLDVKACQAYSFRLL